MLTIERSLNIYAAGIPQIISLSQYDDDFQLVFTLYTSEGEFTIPSGTTAEVMGTKVDGNGYSASASISGSTVTVTGNKQMTACAGRNVYEIVLTKSGKRLATVNFILKVERAALDADTIQSETVLKELNAIIDSAETSTQAAAEAAASAAAAAESARTLTIDPTLTQSGQAADAKVVGDEISGLKEEIDSFEGISDEVKVALLNCFARVSWDEGSGKPYYDALHDALYPTDNLLYDWDFTEGLTDRKQGLTIELRTGGSTLPKLESDGIHYTAAQQFIMPFTYEGLPISYFFGKTIQVDVKSFGAAVTTGNIAFITHRHGSNGWEAGLVFRNSNGWSYYNGSSWSSSIYSDMTGRTDISGKKISIYYDESGYAKLYVDGVFKGTSSVPLLTTDMGGLMIGNNRDATRGGIFYPAVITGLRIYNMEVA